MSRAGRVAGLAAIVAGLATIVAWQAESTATLGTSSRDGAALFQAKGCASCHDGPDTTATIGGFPSLAQTTSWAEARRPGLTGADYLAESIREPWAFEAPDFSPNGPTTAMPALQLADDEVEAIVDYLLVG